MLSYNEAFAIIENEFAQINLQTESVTLMESINRALAEDIISDIDQPPFDNTAMDGIAIKYNPEISSWKIIGEISAGNYQDIDINENNCVRIMTGGKIPPNADTVIPVEDLNENGDTTTLKDGSRLQKGQHLRYKGENLALGEIAVPKNTLIKPHNIGMIAGCGKSEVKVYKKFKIGVLGTGDELVNIEEKPPENKIRATNIYTLLTEIQNINQTPVSFGLIGDDRNKLENKIEEILNSDIDILLTSGGVSVGKYDYLKEVLEEKGMETKFWRSYIKPGKPLLFGTFEKNSRKIIIFGLPGNPVSSYVTFLIYVKANIEKALKIPGFEYVVAELDSDLRKRDAKRHFTRGIIRYSKERESYIVEKSGLNSSGNIAGMSYANCLIIIPEERTNPKKGEKIECIKI